MLYINDIIANLERNFLQMLYRLLISLTFLDHQYKIWHLLPVGLWMIRWAEGFPTSDIFLDPLFENKYNMILYVVKDFKSYRKYILLRSYAIIPSYFNILSVPISWPLVQSDKWRLDCFGCNISSSLFYILKRWWFKITFVLHIIFRFFRGWHIFLLFSQRIEAKDRFVIDLYFVILMNNKFNK